MLRPQLSRLVLVLLLTPAMCWADETPDEGTADKIRIDRDTQTFVTTITIRSTGGQVAWSDVLRGLARARGFDDQALAGLMPDKTFSLNGTGWLLTSTTVNTMFSPGIRFRVKRSQKRGAESSLVVQANREVILASRRRFTKWFRESMTRKSTGRYGLTLANGWDALPPTQNVVIFVHGLESNANALSGWLKLAQADGLPCGSFQYPNDQPIEDSAKLLARELQKFSAKYPDRTISLVAHSMGGLVCRAVIEDPQLDPKNVDQLIMIATPNHGSYLAYFGFALEITSPLLDQNRQRNVDDQLGVIEDGLAESSVDLLPDSILLTKLNRRQRNPQVKYALFLGTEGFISPAELTAIRQRIAEQGEKNRWVRFFGSRAQDWLANLDEVVQGKGDGAVAVKRSRLQGVSDTVVLRFGHLNVLDTTAQGDVAKVHQEMLQRLKNNRR
ncbi:MAG TPA: hypothetical protein DCY79_19980 [Planctomycetaceae bacterium]|nr:hypothetical protein [Blastopirellula sp.]HAY82091.1 hypothetical protein [Planctomycetaceae bacterium]